MSTLFLRVLGLVINSNLLVTGFKFENNVGGGAFKRWSLLIHPNS